MRKIEMQNELKRDLEIAKEDIQQAVETAYNRIYEKHGVEMHTFVDLKPTTAYGQEEVYKPKVNLYIHVSV